MGRSRPIYAMDILGSRNIQVMSKEPERITDIISHKNIDAKLPTPLWQQMGLKKVTTLYKDPDYPLNFELPHPIFTL